MKLGMTVLAGVAAMFVAAAASATLTGLSLGTGPKPLTMGAYTMTPFPLDPQPAGSAPVSSVVSPLGGTVGFSAGTDHRRIGAGWASWSHGYTGDVYYNGGGTTSTLTMPTGTGAFYLYVEPNDFGAHNFSVQAFGTGGNTATVTLTGVLGLSGAAGAGFTASGGRTITSIVITNTDGSALGFAFGQFGIALVPAPGALALLGAAGLVSRRRRRA